MQCYLRVLVVPLQEEKRCRTKHEGVCAPVRPLKASWTCSLRAHTKEYAQKERVCAMLYVSYIQVPSHIYVCPLYMCPHTCVLFIYVSSHMCPMTHVSSHMCPHTCVLFICVPNTYVCMRACSSMRQCCICALYVCVLLLPRVSACG